MSQTRIGVSGWQYPDFSKRFYPDDLEKRDQLSYYAEHFPSVEINNTFYQLPKINTIKNWYDQVPSDFKFSVKANRYITHMKNLLEPEETLPDFYDRISLLAKKCGPILFQLPPNWQIDKARLINFLNVLPGNFRHTIEFRNQTWHREDIYDLLQDKNIAFCIYDFDFQQSPIITTADFVYVRLHGPGRAYHDPYDQESLAHWVERIVSWVNCGFDVYCYFDNTHRGFAWENAQKLLKMLN